MDYRRESCTSSFFGGSESHSSCSFRRSLGVDVTGVLGGIGRVLAQSHV